MRTRTLAGVRPRCPPLPLPPTQGLVGRISCGRHAPSLLLLDQQRTSHSAAGSEVLVQPLGSGQEVVLNRPKALNALNLNMIHLMRPHYSRWEADPNVAFVVMKGAGGKAFCAGGDIRGE